MHNRSCVTPVSVPARLGIELLSTGPAVVRREKGVEWGCRENGEGVEWLGPCREKGEGG